MYEYDKLLHLARVTFVVTRALTKGGYMWRPGQRGHVYRTLPDRITPTVVVAWHGTTVRQPFTVRELRAHVRITG